MQVNNFQNFVDKNVEQNKVSRFLTCVYFHNNLCTDLLVLISIYMLLYCYNGLQGDEMPEPKSMLEATSEANNLASKSEAKETYEEQMKEVCGAERPYINEHVLEIEHLRIHDTALEVFNSRRKMGGEEFSTKYREKLESEIQESFENLKVSPLFYNKFPG